MATLLYRLGRFAYRRAALVITVWVIALAAALGVGLSLGGQTDEKLLDSRHRVAGGARSA
ncbi:MAG: hypothetical protein ACJLS2_05675 [Microcella pacifica]